MAVESTFHKTHCGKLFNKAFCAQRAFRLHRVPKTREWGLTPLSTVGFRGSPQVFFLILGTSMCVFDGVFMHSGPDFSPFGHDLLLEKTFLVTGETKCWTKLFSDSHDFFYFFSTACFFDIISPMSPPPPPPPRRFWKIPIALILGGPSKSCVSKSYTLSLFNYM